MTGTLKVTPERLESTADQFNSQFMKVRNATQGMLDIAAQLNSVWEGEAQRTYYSKLKALDGDMAQIREMIREHIDDLKEMARNYRSAENTNKSTAGGLGVDYVS